MSANIKKSVKNDAQITKVLGNRKLNAKDVFEIKGTKINDENPIIYDTHISEREDILKVILNDSKDYNIIAKMGGGKSIGLSKFCHENNIKVIIAVPLKMNAEQTASKLKKEFDIDAEFIHGDVEQDEIESIIKKRDLRVIFCVYDSIRKLFLVKAFKPSNFILIIDEIHNATIQYGFRYEALQELSKRKIKFKKIINLTGTPEGVLLNESSNVIFEPRVPMKHNVKLLKIVASFPKEAEDIAALATTKKKKGKCVIFINDKKQVESVASAIRNKIERKNIKNGFMQVEVLYSIGKGKKENFNLNLYRYLIENDAIPEGVEYLITTSIISDGVNIHNKDIENIIIVDVKNWWVKRQYIARFREGVDCVYDLLNSSGDKKFNWFNLEDAKINRREAFELHLKSFKQLKEKRKEFGNSIGYVGNINMIPLPESNDFIYFDEDTYEFFLSDEKVGLSIVDDLNNIMYNDHRKAREFYTNIAGFKVIQVGVEKLLPFNNEKNILSPAEKKYVIENFKKIFVVYVNEKYAKHPQRKNIHPLLLDSTGFDQRTFYNNNQKFYSYDTQIMRNLLHKVFELSLYRYPASLLNKLIELKLNNEHSHAKKVERAFYYYFRMDALNNLTLIVDPEISNLLIQDHRDYRLLIEQSKYYEKEAKIIDYKRMKNELQDYKSHEILDALAGLYKISSQSMGKFHVSNYYPTEYSPVEGLMQKFKIDGDQDVIDYSMVSWYMLREDLVKWKNQNDYWPQYVYEGLDLLNKEINISTEQTIIPNTAFQN